MNAQTYQVTAFYDTKDDAEAGANVLKDNGIDASAIEIVSGRQGEAGQGDTAHGQGSDEGFMGKLSNFFMPDEDRHTYAEGLNRGGYVLRAEVDAKDERRVVELLDSDSSVDMDQRSAGWSSEGWNGRYADDAAGSTDTMGAAGTSAGTDRTRTVDNDGEKLDVVEEQLKVGKRDVSHGRVRVRSYTVEENVSQDVTLESQSADIERHKVDRTLTGSEADAAFQDKTITVEESEEEAVIAKEARVVEEIDVHKDVERHTETVTDTVRKQKVDVDRDGDAGTMGKVDTTDTIETTDRDRIETTDKI